VEFAGIDGKFQAVLATSAGFRATRIAMDAESPRAGQGLHANILSTIGHTPVVLLPRLMAEERLPARLALKLEFFNPGGSVKDRIGRAMVEAAEAGGAIIPGRTTIIEPTSGNTGIALALIAAAKGYRLIVVMPEGASIERRRMLRLLGAELELTPTRRGMAGAIARAEEILAGTPDAWMARQFDNPANPDIHARTTAGEIWRDTAGEVDAVVAGLGTGGTLTGIARALKPRKTGLRMIGVEPAESAVLNGDEPGPHLIQGIGAGFHPSVLNLAALDAVERASEREAFAAARAVARLDGVPVGISTGAVLAVMMRLAREPGMEGKLILGIAASFAERYLSTDLFDGM
jgi:cysteine synthase A